MLGGWPIVAAYLILYGCAAVVVVRWSGRSGWSPVHSVALAGGALLTYAWHSFVETPVIGSKGTIDLVGNGFVLLTAAGGKEWSEAANHLTADYPIRLETMTIDDTGFMSAYALDEDGAVLIRPDGYIGWRSRSKTSNPSRTLREAMASMLGRHV